MQPPNHQEEPEVTLHLHSPLPNLKCTRAHIECEFESRSPVYSIMNAPEKEYLKERISEQSEVQGVVISVSEDFQYLNRPRFALKPLEYKPM